MIAMAAERFVLLLLAQHNAAVARHLAVAHVGQVATAHTDGVNLRHLFGHRTEGGHRTEWDALEVHVKSCHDDALAAVGQFVANGNETLVKELRLVNADHFGGFGQEQDGRRGIYGR